MNANGGAKVAVEVRDLVKEFKAPEGGRLVAVQGISFEVYEGEVFGFLGPNGAGKTTTLEIIEGLRAPTSGTTTVLGMDSQKHAAEMKGRIGVQLQSGAYFAELRLEEILDLFGSFYPKQLPPQELLEMVGLVDKRRALVRELSGGQAQRFSIVASLVNDPDVIFLDEPTTGLDPQARHNLWDLIAHIHEDLGKTIILTTHYMEEAQVLCGRVAVIDHGVIQGIDTPLGLIHQLPTAYRIMFATDATVREDELRALPGVASVSKPQLGEFDYELAIERAQVTLPAFLKWAEGSGVGIDDVQVLPATLEDVFLSLTGHSLRE
jgi:ABC-2 type transport system ATP-binding protein